MQLAADNTLYCRTWENDQKVSSSKLYWGQVSVGGHVIFITVILWFYRAWTQVTGA